MRPSSTSKRRARSFACPTSAARVVLINFWATWCGPGRRELPEFVRAYNEGGGDVVVIGVDVQENGKAVREFADEFGADFPIGIGTKAEVADAYRVLGLPMGCEFQTFRCPSLSAHPRLLAMRVRRSDSVWVTRVPAGWDQRWPPAGRRASVQCWAAS